MATTLRACLLVDCTSSRKPEYFGVHTSATSTPVDFKKCAAGVLGKSFSEECSVRCFFHMAYFRAHGLMSCPKGGSHSHGLVQDLDDGTTLILGTRFGSEIGVRFEVNRNQDFRSVDYHSGADFHSGTDFMALCLQHGSYSRQLICWRVLKTKPSHSMQISGNTYSHVPYACVSTGVFLPAPPGDCTGPRVGIIPVPVLVPMWSTADGAAVSNLKAPSLKVLADKVSAVMRRWGVLEKVSPSRCASQHSCENRVSLLVTAAMAVQRRQLSCHKNQSSCMCVCRVSVFCRNGCNAGSKYMTSHAGCLI